MKVLSIILFFLSNQQASEEGGKSDLNFFLIILIALVLLFVAVTIFFYGLFLGRKMIKTSNGNEHKSREKLEKKKRRQDAPVSEIIRLQKQNKELINENTELRNEISQLKEKKFKPDFLKIESNPPEPQAQDIKNSGNAIKDQDLEPTQEIISVYFEYPELDGSFKKDYGSKSKQAKTYFEIAYKKGHMEGELKFVADRNFYGKILSLRDTSLSPVSDIENSGGIDRPTSITIIENGIVEIKEDRFIVKEYHKLKLKIS